jgi:cellulose synthase operon protein C
MARLTETVLQEAVLKLQQRDYARARSDAEEVLRRVPDDVRAARIAAGTYADQGDPAKALDRLVQIVALRPNSASLQALLGEWYFFRASRLPEARQAFETASTNDPSFLTADFDLAEIDLRENRAEAARQRLRGIVTANPRNFVALILLAKAEEAAGDRAAVMEVYRRVLTLEPSNVIALNNLGYLLAAKHPDQALGFAQKAVEMEPENPDFLDTLGWVYYRQGNYGSATRYLKAAVAKQPTPQRQFHLALAYLKSGEKDLGQKLLATALAQDASLAKKEQGW